MKKIIGCDIILLCENVYRFLNYDKIYGGIAMSDTMNISPELLEKMNRYWEAANYLSAGQLYLLDNPLLREPLTMDHVKKR